MKRNELLRKIIISCFVGVPLLSSIVSTVHLVDLFAKGNPSWISYALAITIEVGSIASFLMLSIMNKLNKGIVWSMFILLFLMQVIGNVYYSYDWIGKKLADDPTWINSFKEMIEFFMYKLEIADVKMYLAMLVGVPVPLISVFLLKSVIDYVGDDKEELKVPEIEIVPEPEIVAENVPVEEEISQPEDVAIAPLPDFELPTESEDERNRIHPAHL